ncbi:alpha/beta hydrolase [Parasphingorhabdus sp. JC815]|uniref:alpha/beta hydrolase n=1 Tax=Parasphingorhabdus sp. JC815 TaxID=3232140 RepID=UPI003458517A
MNRPNPPIFDRRSVPDEVQELVWHAPDGWAIRQLDWLQPDKNARGSILFMTGRADFYEKYLETFNDFHAAGWNITSPDWRGQGGSGRCGPHRHVGHIESFSIWVDDLTAFYRQWRRDYPGPHIVIGHSMGGHLVARALAEQRIHSDAAILSAPMLALAGGGMPEWTAHLVAKIMCLFGRGNRRAWKVSEKPLEPEVLRQGLLTHDATRYSDEFFWFKERPFVRLGPGSWRWVEQAYASARKLRNKKNLKAVDTPVLVLATSADELVDHATIERAVHLMPNAEMKLFGPESAHEIYREANPVRNAALQASFEFLDRVAPQKPLHEH